jgi:glyoxylase-like metal-dependent hydrolase (beta-lactamase superfamily II)
MSAMEITPGVHMVDGMGMGRAYLYQEADRLTLIDTGLPNSVARVLAEVERAGRRPGDLRQIAVTHWHIDHAGSLAALVERTGAQVLAHPLDASIVRGEREGSGPRGVWAALAPLFRRGPKLQRTRVDREVTDGDEIDLDGGARIVHAPGHTAGSIAVFLPARRLIFTGDAAANVFGLRPTIGMFTEDTPQARASFAKLAQLDFDVALFGHGEPMHKDASLAFRRLAEKLAR